MLIKRDQLTDTSVKLTVTADQKEIDEFRNLTLKKLKRDVSVPGFRPGKAPENLVEKHLDQSRYHSDFLDLSINELYVKGVESELLRPVGQPDISLTKFVPFSELEFTATMDVIGTIKLADYKNVKIPLLKTETNAEDIKKILENLRTRSAKKTESKAAAKQGDEVTIDFKGTDAKTKEPIPGTDGKSYPLVLGSNNFIPGFEDELIGLKAGDTKTFQITFPKDYSAASLKSKKVQFEVAVSQVTKLEKPKLDDAFAATVGPFETLDALKKDVKKQLEAEKAREDLQKFDNDLIQMLVEKSSVKIPPALIEEEIDRLEEEEKRNLVYRGQTWQEHLTEEGLSESEHREKQRDNAENRVKAGLILSEISQIERITVTPEELEMRIKQLKKQYTDKSMQKELDNPTNRRDVLSRILTEKTIDYLRRTTTK